jgi:hypothetical protein
MFRPSCPNSPIGSAPRCRATRWRAPRLGVSPAKLWRMEDIERFQLAAAQWVSGATSTSNGVAVNRELASGTSVRTVVVVEGTSDAAAVARLAVRLGRDLHEEGVAIVPLGGATSIGRFIDVFVQQQLDVRLSGLCDDREEGYYRRALARAGLGDNLTRADLNRLGFQVCVADLEDELIRSHGTASVEQVIEAQGELRAFRTFQRQPAQRERSPGQQLRRFMGTHSGRKLQYADALVQALDLDRVPEPLARLLAYI